MEDETHQIHPAFLRLLKNSTYGFGFRIPQPEEEPYPYESLGNGYELRPIQLFDKDGNSIDNQARYSHLYLNGLQISDQVFRKGGLCGGFRGGYCELIFYTQDVKLKEGFSSGRHVIINESGKIMLKGSDSISYPYHPGGNVGKLGDIYYDLRSGKPIMTASSSGSISSKNLIIIEHRYDWYNKELPLGVYTINKTTCAVTKIDDIK